MNPQFPGFTAHNFAAADGQSLTVWQSQRIPQRPLLHWAHATGFNAGTYQCLLQNLATHTNVMAWDMRGHGTSRDAAVRSTFRGWPTYYNDLAQLLRQQDQPVWLAGHSLGGMTSLAAATQIPERVAGVILVEPVILSGLSAAVLRLARSTRQMSRMGIVAGAAGRRFQFASRQQAWQNYRTKRTFATWPDHWLQAYVDHGFVDRDDGTVELACRPEWEALTFSTTEHRPYRRLHHLPADLPIHVLVAERRSTMPQRSRAILQKRLPQAVITQIPGTSHFLPMEREQLVLDRILETIGQP